MGLLNAIRVANQVALRITPRAVVPNQYVTITTPAFNYHPNSDQGRNNRFDYAGFVMYGNRSLANGFGWIFIKTIAEIEANRQPGDEGQVHGTLARITFGQQPSQIVAAGNICGGFSIANNILQINSNSFNIPVNGQGQPFDSHYHNGIRALSAVEQEVLRAFFNL